MHHYNESSTTLLNWGMNPIIAMILDPGNNQNKNTGLDTRFMRTLLNEGAISQQTMFELVPIHSSYLPTFSDVKHRASLGRGSRSNSCVEIPLWAAWLLLRSRHERFDQKIEAVEFLHETGISPWVEQVFPQLELDIIGFDLLSHINKTAESDSKSKLIRLVHSHLSKSEKEYLNARIEKEAFEPWFYCAKNATTITEAQELDAIGVSGLKTKGLLHVSSNQGEVTEEKVKLGYDASMARRHIIKTLSNKPDRINAIEYLDKKYLAADAEYTKSNEDHIINNLAIGSSKIERELKSFQEDNKENPRWPVHFSGQGIGYTLLAMMTDTYLGARDQIGGEIIDMLMEERKKNPAWWDSGAQQEVAGLEGTGLTELQCLKLAMLMIKKENNDPVLDFQAGEMEHCIAALQKSNKIRISEEDICMFIDSNKEAWTAWAKNPIEEDMELRWKLCQKTSPFWQLGRLLDGQMEEIEGAEPLEYVLANALIAKHCFIYQQNKEPSNPDDLKRWKEMHFTTWALSIFGVAINETVYEGANFMEVDLVLDVLDPHFFKDEPQYQEQFMHVLDVLKKKLSYDTMNTDDQSLLDLLSKPGETSDIGVNQRTAALFSAIKKAQLSCIVPTHEVSSNYKLKQPKM